MPYKDLKKQREYQKKWMRKRRYDWFKDKSCQSCGSIKNLEIDHIDPKKKKTHAIWSYSETKRNEELKKCQVLCKECHIVKSTKDGSDPNRKYAYKHGTKQMYETHKCRCEDCRKWRHEKYIKRRCSVAA